MRKPVSPKKLLTIGLGVIAGLCGAVCLAVVSARLDPMFAASVDLDADVDAEPTPGSRHAMQALAATSSTQNATA